MPKCDHCGTQCQLPYHCSYCGGSYCSDHRLPPSHNCINEDRWRDRTSKPAYDVKPQGESPSLPQTECFFCGVKSSKTFYCPQCGHDFCSLHKRHQDHHSDPVRTNEQQKSSNSPRTEEPSKNVISYQLVVAFLLMVAIIIGAAFAFGIINLPSVTPASNVPPTQMQQYVTVAAPYNTINLLPIPTRIEYPRPTTGTIISGNTMYGGKGELTIDNLLGGSDTIAVLTHIGRKDTLISVYLRSGEIYTMKNIADGNYDLYIQYGGNWNPGEKKFADNPRYTRFEDSFPYTTRISTKETDTEIITNSDYTTWRVTLYEVVAGNAETEELSEDNFPDL